MARELKIFRYRRNIGVVVSTMMDMNCQEALPKKWKAPLWLVDPRRDAKVSCPSAKGAAPAAVMHPPAAPVAPERVSSPPHAVEAAVSKIGWTDQELSVDDYMVGGVTMFDAQTGLGLPPASK
jgi:hypothetical protein